MQDTSSLEKQGLEGEDLAPFDYEFFLNLYQEMLGDVWDRAGKIRTVEMNFGVKAYQVSSELRKLVMT